MPWATSDRRARLPRNWQALRATVLRRDNWTCSIHGPGCTRFATEVDHIQPGDDHTLTNLQAVCHTCHARKTVAESTAGQAAVRSRSRRPPEAHPGVGVTP
jgi:5-methylcytosine-specific restriction enzyme A